MSDDDSIDRENRTVTGASDRGATGDPASGSGDDGSPDASGVSPDDRNGTSSARRRYGMERLRPVDGTEGLLSVRELRYLRHAGRLDRTDRNSLYELLDDRIEHFLETEWPIIADSYPEYAERVRETVCGDDPT